MNLGASMLAKRVHQEENDPLTLRGMAIGIPAGIALWTGIIWLLSVIVG